MPASVHLFKRHPNAVLIETGTYLGDGVLAALAAGFQTVRSVELSDTLYAKNLQRFAGEKRVRLFHGSSEDQLWTMIADIRAPMTFWLDAHYSQGVTAMGKEMNPLLKELEIISRHPIKTHTLLIDDRRLAGTADFGFITEDQIRASIQAIHPGYRFSYETGSAANPMFHDDIIAARPA